MPDSDEQLAALGQQVLDQLIETYDPDNAPDLALAILPGQVVDADIVQNGVQNPLVVSDWLHDAFDDALSLRLADATALPTAVGSISSLSAAYREAIGFARPTAPAGSPEFDRLAAMIAEAHNALGPAPAFLPLGCDPDDWAQPSRDGYWRVFDTVIKTSHSETTTDTDDGPIKVNRNLWRMEALDSRPTMGISGRAERLAIDQGSREALRERIMKAAQPAVAPDAPMLHAFAPEAGLASMAILAEPTAEPTVVAMPASALKLSALKLNLAGFAAPDVQPHLQVKSHISDMTLDEVVVGATVEPEANKVIRLRRPLRWLFGEDAPKAQTTTTTTTTSELSVHFEHCLVTITRKFAGNQWWLPRLIADDGWYVPGLAKGELVPAPSDGVAHCLPRALLLVRKVSMTGSWTDDAKSTFVQPATRIGPFVLDPGSAAAAAASHEQRTTVLGDGIQVIGVFGTPLPAIPPQDPPLA